MCHLNERMIPFLLFLIVFGSMGPIIASAQSINGPQVGITFTISPMDPEDQVIVVSEEREGSVTFNATVTVDKPPVIGTVTVNLDGTISTGWVTIVSPQTITFQRSGSVDITVTVTAPKATSCESVGRLMVIGVATYPGGSRTAASSGSVMVRQYFGASVEPAPKKGIDNPTRFNLVVTNKGNCHDSFNLEIKEKAKMEEKGFGFSFDKIKTEEILSDENETVHLKVDYGINAPSGKNVMILVVESITSNKNASVPYILEVPLEMDVNHLSASSPLTYGISAVIIIVIVMIALFTLRKKGWKQKFRKKEDG